MSSVPATDAAASAGRAWTLRTVLVAFAIAYGTYAAARWLGLGVATAQGNASWVIHLERSLGLDVECPVQRALDAPAAVWTVNHLYLAAQFLFVPAALLIVRRRSVLAFRRLRDTLLLTWVLATPINALFPVAPPRMAGIGVADTITASGSDALTSGLSTTLYNPLAAVPSLHVAFAFAVGIAVATTGGSRLLRALGLLWGPIIALVVVATGNHYVFDAVTGVALTALAYRLVLLPHPSLVDSGALARRMAASAGARALQGLRLTGDGLLHVGRAVTPQTRDEVVTLGSATRPPRPTGEDPRGRRTDGGPGRNALPH